VIHAVQAPVVGSVGYPGSNHLLALRSREIAAGSRPGQFVMAGLADSPSDPLLKRALAVYSLPQENGDGEILTLLIKVVGPGTRQLAAVREGSQVSLIGPLGNGFDTSRARGRVSVLVAGGVGIASVYLLAKKIREAGEEVHLLYGARRARDLVGLEDFQELGIRVEVATEDGSRGVQGLVTQILEPYFSHYSTETLTLYTCGPNPMMQAVSGLATTHGVDCQVSVETPMACGFGVCLGCSVRTVHSYRLACSHGPVFDAREMVWDTANESEGVHA
jgi:dihydroorotate dehydrogenase electron transfer subunit